MHKPARMTRLETTFKTKALRVLNIPTLVPRLFEICCLLLVIVVEVSLLWVPAAISGGIWVRRLCATRSERFALLFDEG
jgi:hypothetical protein